MTADMRDDEAEVLEYHTCRDLHSGIGDVFNYARCQETSFNDTAESCMLLTAEMLLLGA